MIKTSPLRSCPAQGRLSWQMRMMIPTVVHIARKPFRKMTIFVRSAERYLPTTSPARSIPPNPLKASALSVRDPSVEVVEAG